MTELSQIKTEMVLMSPEQAEAHLRHTQANMEAGSFRQRNIIPSRAHRYANDIIQGAWISTPQTVSIDEHGNVLDGRHRLTAIIIAKKSVWVNLSTGWPEKQFNQKNEERPTSDGIDMGKARTVGMQLQIGYGVQNSSYYSASAKVIAEICLGSDRVNLTTSQTLLILGIYGKALEAIIGLTGNSRNHCAYLLAPFAFNYVVAPEKTIGFAEQMFSMVGLSDGSPVLAFVKWQAKHPGKRVSERIDVARAAFVCLKAYENLEDVSTVWPNRNNILDWAYDRQAQNVQMVRQALGF